MNRILILTETEAATMQEEGLVESRYVVRAPDYLTEEERAKGTVILPEQHLYFVSGSPCVEGTAG